MLFILQKFTAFLVARVGTFLVLAAILILSSALWLAGDYYFRASERRAVEVEELTESRERRLAEVRTQLEAAADEAGRMLEEVRTRSDELTAELKASAAKLSAARERIRELEGWWTRLRAWFGAETARERLRDLEAERRRAARLQEEGERLRNGIAELGERMSNLRGRVAEPDNALAGEASVLEEELAAYRIEAAELEKISEHRRRLLDTSLLWLKRGFAVALPAVAVLAFALFVLPMLLKVLCFYAWAPLLQRAAPVRLGTPVRPEDSRPTIGESRTAIELEIAPANVVTLNHHYYQASDEELIKRTRFLLDWRHPFTSLACRQFFLTRVETYGTAPGRITISSQSDPTCEIARVDLPAGTSLILRPSHLVAVIERPEAGLSIRSHWRLASLHAWITMQFRYFEFKGPCALVIRGRRGVRAETVSAGTDASRSARRTNQAATLGFTPSLVYFSRRAETFLSYFTGKNALFDDAFSGDGVFLCQQISRDDETNAPHAFLKRIGEALSRLLGF